MRGIKLKGRVLDFDGGENASYHEVISCKSYESVNIDPSINPTWVTKVNERIPYPPNVYDTVISLNTLEHIYDVAFVLDEITRVLKQDGVFVCAIPFLHGIHAHPDDYFRPTPSW